MGVIIRFIHFADCHINNVQSGRIRNGIPERVLDVLHNLQKLVDFAIEKKVTYVFFAGDAYRTNRPANMYRTMFEDEILRLSKNNIKVIMIAGNHDMTRRFGSKHALSEFKHLDVSNVYILDDIEFVEFDDCVILGIRWQFEPIEIPNPPQTDKPIIALVHATVKGVLPIVDTVETVLGREFIIDLKELDFCDYIALGHIHKHMVFNNPLAIYPSNLEALKWGESGKHGFVYGEFKPKLNWEYIELPTRPRFDIITTPDEFIPPKINSEAIYRITINYEKYTPNDEKLKVDKYFRDAFDFTIRHNSPPKVYKKGGLEIDPNLDHTTILELYLDNQFEEVKDLWYEIQTSVQS